MTRVRKFKPEEIAHIVCVEDVYVCSVCRELYEPRRRIRFHRHKWMRKHVQCAKEPRHNQILECSVPEARGIDDQMPKTQHLLDRQVRHFPYEAAGDGRDYGRAQAKQDWHRRGRQTDKAICKEWPEKDENE